MDLDFKFKGFTTTGSIETYIEKRFHTLQRRLDERYNNAKVTLRGSVYARTPQGQAKSFTAELIVKVPRNKSPFVVKKTDKNFRSACSEAVAAMEKVLRRDSEKTERSRRTLGRTLRSVRESRRSV